MPLSSGPLEDRIAIRELHDSYGDAVFRRHTEDWAANWAPDAVWNLMGNDVTGRDTIAAVWQQAMGGFSFVAFFTQPGVITITGDTAHGVVYTHEVLEREEGKPFRMVGTYTDDYIKIDGRWHFKKRAYKPLKEN